MKRYQTAVCALALMLACVPLAACGSQNSADKDWEEPVPPVEEPLPPNQEIGPHPEIPLSLKKISHPTRPRRHT